MTTTPRNYPIAALVVGYRYGNAPTSGYSYNYAENKQECGVSMASAGAMPESRSFATMTAKEGRKACYYRGIIAGTGGDDEICLVQCEKITRKEYLAEIKSPISLELADIQAERRAYWQAHNLRTGLEQCLFIGADDRNERITQRYADEIAHIRRRFGDLVADKVALFCPLDKMLR